MKTYHEYTNLSQKIHAPEELKAKVLQSAAESSRSRKKASAGHYSRGWSALQKAAAAAVAAVLAVTLPIAGYAAVNGLGLKDYLAQRGMQDVQAVDELTNSGEEIAANQPTSATQEPTSATQEQAEDKGLVTYSNQYAKYTILEAALDSETVYLAARITPLDDSYFLVPNCIGWNEPASGLQIEGTTEGTVEQYAASQGKVPVTVSVGATGEVSNGSAQDFRYNEDGSMNYYWIGQNPSGEKEITLNCAANGTRGNIEPDNRIEFDLQLKDKSSAKEKIYRSFDPAAFDETGVQVTELTLKQTEIGLYATFTFRTDNAKINGIFFKILDANGEELDTLPLVSGGARVDSGGISTCRVFYQIPDTLDGLQFAIRDVWESINYGPYSFSE